MIRKFYDIDLTDSVGIQNTEGVEAKAKAMRQSILYILFRDTGVAGDELEKATKAVLIFCVDEIIKECNDVMSVKEMGIDYKESTYYKYWQSVKEATTKL